MAGGANWHGTSGQLISLQDKEARRLLVKGGVVAVALQFTQHHSQAVAAAALDAWGQAASDAEEEVHIPTDAGLLLRNLI